MLTRACSPQYELGLGYELGLPSAAIIEEYFRALCSELANVLCTALRVHHRASRSRIRMVLYVKGGGPGLGAEGPSRKHYHRPDGQQARSLVQRQRSPPSLESRRGSTPLLVGLPVGLQDRPSDPPGCYRPSNAAPLQAVRRAATRPGGGGGAAAHVSLCG